MESNQEAIHHKLNTRRLGLTFLSTVVTTKTFLLWWHTHAAISHNYLIYLNWVPRCKLCYLPSGKVNMCGPSRKVRERCVMTGPLVSGKVWNIPVSPKLQSNENRTELQHRYHCWPLTWHDLDESCTKTFLEMWWIHTLHLVAIGLLARETAANVQTHISRIYMCMTI